MLNEGGPYGYKYKEEEEKSPEVDVAAEGEEGRGMGWVGTLVCRPSEVLEVCKSKRGVRESVRNAATLNFEAGWAENLM